MNDKLVSTQGVNEGKSVWSALDDMLTDVEILRHVQGAVVDDLLQIDFMQELVEYNEQRFALLNFVAETMFEKLGSISKRINALMHCDGVKTIFCHRKEN